MKRANVTLDGIMVFAGLYTEHEKDLSQGLRRLIAASDDLTGAIEGTTDRFDREVAALMDATGAAERLLKGGVS